MFTLPINEDHSLLSMRFPQKLWKIVNECSTGAIQWSKNGKSLLLDYTKFQRDYLDSKLEIFKTTNITSFIRQLNLYGFRKVTGHYREPLSSLQSPDIHEFRNENFVRGRYDLLSKVSRKTGIMKHRTTERKRNVEDSPENESANKSRLVLCQKALTDALNNAAMQQEKHKQTYNDDNESVLSDFSGSQDSDWDSLDWLREPSGSQTTHSSNTEDSIPGSSSGKQHSYQQSNKPLQSSHSGDSQGTMSSLLDPSISPQRSLGATASDLPVMDCPFSLEYVMQQMDSSLTEKIYEMLMEEETKPEMILPDLPCDFAPPAKKGRMDPDAASSFFKSEPPDDLEQPCCSSYSRQQSDSSSGDETPGFHDGHSDYMYKDQILPCVKQEPQVYYEHEYRNAQSSNAQNANASHSMNYYPHRTSYYGNVGTGHHYMY